MNTAGLAVTDATIEMLKQMEATMKSALSDGVKEEEATIKTSDELMESKGQEVEVTWRRISLTLRINWSQKDLLKSLDEFCATLRYTDTGVGRAIKDQSRRAEKDFE